MNTHENLIESVIGREAYLTLCDWSGGISLYIPRSVNTASGRYLVEEIGKEAAERLVQWAGGSTIAIPSRNGQIIKRRQRELRVMRDRGMTIQEIAKIYRYEGRYTERQIYRLLNKA